MGMTVAEKLFTRKNTQERPVKAGDFVAPGVSDIVEDGQRLEIDYSEGVVRNVETGAAVRISTYPPSVERIFRAGGIIPLLMDRYDQETRV